jgi:hypothetical protein
MITVSVGGTGRVVNESFVPVLFCHCACTKSRNTYDYHRCYCCSSCYHCCTPCGIDRVHGARLMLYKKKKKKIKKILHSIRLEANVTIARCDSCLKNKPHRPGPYLTSIRPGATTFCRPSSVKCKAVNKRLQLFVK